MLSVHQTRDHQENPGSDDVHDEAVKSVSAHQECLNEADNRQHQKAGSRSEGEGRNQNRNVREVIGQKRYRRNQRESNQSDDTGKRRHHRHFYKLL